MRLHYLQHMSFENPGNILVWAREKEYQISGTRYFEHAQSPDLEALDWLVVMGGPMNVYKELKYPWLTEEKKLIERAIAMNKTVVGICLGAQLIADVLGARIYKNEHREIGWFPMTCTDEGAQSPVFNMLFPGFTVFQWHGDTFSIPDGAIRLAQSKACLNQAFSYRGRVLGLQFHLESTMENVRLLCENCADELEPGPYVQNPEYMLAQFQVLNNMKVKLYEMLNGLDRERISSTPWE